MTSLPRFYYHEPEYESEAASLSLDGGDVYPLERVYVDLPHLERPTQVRVSVQHQEELLYLRRRPTRNLKGDEEDVCLFIKVVCNMGGFLNKDRKSLLSWQEGQL